MSARLAAYEVVRRTFEEGAYADRVFPPEAEKAKLDERDRRLAMRLAYGTVQRVRTLDHAMETLASRPPGQLQPTLRAALRLGAYQILRPRIPPHAAVSATVFHLMPVGKPAPPRPRKPEAFISLMIHSWPLSINFFVLSHAPRAMAPLRRQSPKP